MSDGDEITPEEVTRLATHAANLFPALALLHCPDDATHALVYPEQPDPAVQQSLNTAIVTALVNAGTAVFAQPVDRATYLAWLDGSTSTRCWRQAYRDPARLVGGEAALRLFGVPATAVGPRPNPPAPRDKKRSPADQLIRVWEEGTQASDPSLGALLDAGREGVVEMAVRKVMERYTQEASDDFLAWLNDAAGHVPLEPYGEAKFIVVPVVAAAQPLPDPAQMARRFLGCGALAPAQEAAFLPSWFDVDDLIGLSPCALRRTLREILEGRPLSALQPLQQLEDDGPMALLGVVHERYPVAWETAADLLDPPDDDAPDPVADRYAAAFDRWREAEFDETPALLDILYPTTPARLAEDLDAATEEADEADEPELPTVASEEIASFVEIAEDEAKGEAVVGIMRVIDGQVELALYTASGRPLDARVFGAAVDGAVPEALHRAIHDAVKVVDSPPRRN